MSLGKHIRECPDCSVYHNKKIAQAKLEAYDECIKITELIEEDYSESLLWLRDSIEECKSR